MLKQCLGMDFTAVLYVLPGLESQVRAADQTITDGTARRRTRTRHRRSVHPSSFPSSFAFALAHPGHAYTHRDHGRTADTVVLTHAPVGLESQSQFAEEIGGPAPQDILEKPLDKEDNMRMLLDLNGGRCEVVTGVTIGASFQSSVFGSRSVH